MRPKKRILLIVANEDHRSELRFALETWGYYVIEKPEGEVDATVNSSDAPLFLGSQSELRERIRIMSARKRGPKKKQPSFVPEEIGAGRKAG